LYHSTSKANVEFDIFIPKLSLAFEYQGEQHYKDFFNVESNIQKKRDEEKRQLCKSNEITLISVPFWWSLSEAELWSTISKYRPDLVKRDGRFQ